MQKQQSDCPKLGNQIVERIFEYWKRVLEKFKGWIIFSVIMEGIAINL